MKGRTDAVVPDAWGGYMDAGDWDRRIQHLIVSRYLLELADTFPETFRGVKLNIPESGSGLPDVVSEALFNLDCYRRMQTADGGIRGGIESSEHPREGEGSWQESLEVLAYAPDVWSSHWYAGVAARAALVLRDVRPDLSQVYRDSALRAMEFAEQHWAELGEPKPADGGVIDQRNHGRSRTLSPHRRRALAPSVSGDHGLPRRQIAALRMAEAQPARQRLGLCEDVALERRRRPSGQLPPGDPGGGRRSRRRSASAPVSAGPSSNGSRRRTAHSRVPTVSAWPAHTP